MAEKMLFQIAIERIVDRIAKLPKEQSERLTKIISEFQSFDCGTTYTDEVKIEIFEMLFPDLASKKKGWWQD